MHGRIEVVTGVFSIPLEKLRSATPRPALRDDRPQVRINQFIGDETNGLVRIAAESFLADSPPRFNPLTFFGPTATGKTHLAFGLAARWKRHHPNASLHVSSGADFARAYATAVDTDAVDDFRKTHFQVDCLVIDGLDEFSKKPAVQQELCVAIDQLRDRQKRVLITSRLAPGEMPQLLSALASRLSDGLTVPFSPPGPAARQVIVQQLSKLHGIALPDDVLDLLAGQRMAGDAPLQAATLQTVPQLNHAFVQLSAAANLSRQPITADDARSFLHLQSNDQKVTVSRITTAVSKYFGVKSADLKSPSRRQLIVRARGVVVYLARKLTSQSLDAIGAEFGGRDHTTILHACRKTEDLLSSDPALQTAVDELTRQLTTRV